MATRYFGLHWTDDNGTALQARLDLASRQIWARYSEQGGEWSEWRRLDVERNSEGRIKGTCENAVNCDVAAAAKRLATPFAIKLTGQVNGSGIIDGCTPVEISVALADNGEFAALKKRIESLERKHENLSKKVENLHKWDENIDPGV